MIGVRGFTGVDALPNRAFADCDVTRETTESTDCPKLRVGVVGLSAVGVVGLIAVGVVGLIAVGVVGLIAVGVVVLSAVGVVGLIEVGVVGLILEAIGAGLGVPTVGRRESMTRGRTVASGVLLLARSILLEVTCGWERAIWDAQKVMEGEQSSPTASLTNFWTCEV